MRFVLGRFNDLRIKTYTTFRDKNLLINDLQVVSFLLFQVLMFPPRWGYNVLSLSVSSHLSIHPKQFARKMVL